MRTQLFAAATGFAVAAAFGISVAAQTPPTTPPANPPTTTPQTSQPAQTAPDRGDAQQVTLVGCVQRETDYRQAHNLGRGGTVGTGVGAANEFVLINASATGGAMAGSPSGTATGTGAATGTATGTPTGTATGTATGTSGASATAAGQAFEVTGANEAQLAQYVGQRVEITGKLKM